LLGLQKCLEQTFKDWGEVAHNFFDLAIGLRKFLWVANILKQSSDDLKVLGHDEPRSYLLDEKHKHAEEGVFYPDIPT
jgi:hypothetical protein